MKFEITPEKNGTPELIEKIKRNELDGAIVQFDGTISADPSTFKIIAALHDEYFFMLAKADSKFDSVKDLSPNDTIAIGSGGAALTWSNFCKADKDYIAIPTVPTAGPMALADLSAGKISAVAMSGGLKLGDMLRANEQAGAFKLLSVNDGAFDNMKVNGIRVYEFAKISSSQFKNLISWGGEKTLKTKAVFIVSTAWLQDHEDAFDRLYDAVTKAVPNINKELEKE